MDGGVLDNLPVTALSRAEGPLLAVHIGLGADADHPAAPSPESPESLLTVPSLGDTLLRTMMLASGNAADEAMRLADLVIRPDATGVGLLEWDQIDRMREAGRAATLAALPRILEMVSR